MNTKHFSVENINIDLHIHSNASFYKDGSIVSNSTQENTQLLIEALEKNKINMFAITDHNRFDFELYEKLVDEVKKSQIIKKVLPGIEFDVQLELGKPKCHIIAIFDDNDMNTIKDISNKIKGIKELKKDEVYSINEFEQILKNIGLKVILIAHQKQSLDNKKGDSESLSGACGDPYYFIETGYIDSLEFNNNRVEGIVKDSLNRVSIKFPLITGSDCHDWGSYPYRDSSSKCERKFTAVKCLPTFKGLLMAISSFESRANRTANSNLNYIEKIKLNDKEYPLSNGINAIIGDNGSGKTLLLNEICGGEHKYYDSLVKSNSLSFVYNSNDFQNESINYVRQGEINKKVIEGTLFDESSDYYDEIPNKNIFSENIENYFEKINKYINMKIKIKENKETMIKTSILIEPVKRNFYLPFVNSDITLEDITDDKQRKNMMREKINSIKSEFDLNKEYYSQLGLNEKIEDVLKRLEEIYQIVNLSYSKKDRNNKVRSIISSKLKDYETSLTERRTSEEKVSTEKLSEYNSFKNKIIELIKAESKKNDYPEFPEKICGYSVKQVGDYNFTKITKYNDVYLKDEFYKYCFNSEYNEEEKVKQIASKDEYKKALKGCTSLQEIDKYKTQKIKGFINVWSKESTYISEVSSQESIGNTPGEISLVYYKFQIKEKQQDFSVLAIDQPEDDINPKRIEKFLLQFLGSIRDKKQILIVTHNPLLVVNLDVDNVIYLEKKNKTINIKYGALEYDEEYNILDLIKENLDGGYKAIERRIKKYDRN